jgi:hypothetical protein
MISNFFAGSTKSLVCSSFDCSVRVLTNMDLCKPNAAGQSVIPTPTLGQRARPFLLDSRKARTDRGGLQRGCDRRHPNRAR